MGSAPCPQDRDASYSGCRARLCRFALRRTQRGRKLFGRPQAPYLRWRVFGSCPSPGMFMGSTPCPQDRTLPLFGVPNPSKTQAVWESPSPISPMVCIWELPKPRGSLWGVPHAPRTETQAIRGAALGFAASLCEEPNEDASCLGVPKPHISDGVYLGVAQAPRLFMGSTPCPQEMDASYSGCRTLSKDASCLGVPKPQGCLWGVPHAPKQDAAAIRGAEPNMIVSFFTFHSFTFHSHLT